jgi:non-heme chloroperoxidase
MWEPQLARFTGPKWRVIAPPLIRVPGDGRRLTMDDVAGEVIDALDREHVAEAVVVGLSMGGYAALAMFRHAPRYVQGLVLCDTRSEADTDEGKEGRRKMQQTAREKGPGAIADEMIPKLLGSTTRGTSPDVVERVRALILSNTPETIAAALDALMSRHDSTDLLGSIHCPTLIVVGEEDSVTPRVLSEKMHAGIAGSRLQVIPRAGHLSSLEQPEAFNGALADFLEHRI